MTRVQLHFDLERPLDEATLDAISAAHGIYGLGRIVPEPDARRLVVDYDASRLTAEDVEAILRRLGIALKV